MTEKVMHTTNNLQKHVGFYVLNQIARTTVVRKYQTWKRALSQLHDSLSTVVAKIYNAQQLCYSLHGWVEKKGIKYST